MTTQGIHHFTGQAVYVPGHDIDTDQIIPGRFLRCVTFDELKEGLFYDARFDADGVKKGHPLDDPGAKGASILISDDHFGCGSSREHAPQALKKGGFGAVIAGSYAEIFFGNATGLGMICISMVAEDRQELVAFVKENPASKVAIDLEDMQVTCEGREESWPCQMRASARNALLDGSYDPLNLLLEGKEPVERVNASLNY